MRPRARSRASKAESARRPQTASSSKRPMASRPSAAPAMPENFSFASTGTGLSARPTLSSPDPHRQDGSRPVVQISCRARLRAGAADYTASMAASPGKMDIGAWITLANGNGMSFPNARVQIVAGRLNRESGEIEPISLGQPLLAQCWPRAPPATPRSDLHRTRLPVGL